MGNGQWAVGNPPPGPLRPLPIAYPHCPLPIPCSLPLSLPESRMILAYEAYNQVGQAVRGTVEASTLQEATERLYRDGLYVSAIHEADHAGASAGNSGRAKGLRRDAGTGG